MSIGESAARRALRENTLAVSGLIQKHLHDLPDHLVQDSFISQGLVDGINSKQGVAAASKASEYLSAVKGKVNSGNDAELGRQWLEKFVTILLTFEDVGTVAKNIAAAYVRHAKRRSQFFSDIAQGVSMSGAIEDDGSQAQEEKEEKTTTGLMLSATPTLAQLKRLKSPNSRDICIIDDVAAKCDDLAILMDFDPFGNTLASMKKDFGSVQERCTEVFRKWLGGEGKRQPATWRMLVKLLKECERSVLAGEIVKVLN